MTMAITLRGRWMRRGRCSMRDELAVASRYWDIGELGDMHHNPAKNVLHRKFTLEEVAAQTGTIGGGSCAA